MFSLDDAVVAWRRQMLMAGVQSPEPLDELESHLLDDVDQQMNSGLDAARAFEVAARRMGPAVELQSEFQKAHPNQQMKQKLTKILIVIAVLAFGASLILPAAAKWKAHETFAPGDIFQFTVTIFAYGALCGGLCVYEVLNRRRHA
jgi:hypothetical protein